MSFSALRRISSCCWQMLSRCCWANSILSCNAPTSASFSAVSWAIVVCRRFSRAARTCSWKIESSEEKTLIAKRKERIELLSLVLLWVSGRSPRYSCGYWRVAVDILLPDCPPVAKATPLFRCSAFQSSLGRESSVQPAKGIAFLQFPSYCGLQENDDKWRTRPVTTTKVKVKTARALPWFKYPCDAYDNIHAGKSIQLKYSNGHSWIMDPFVYFR